MSSGVHYQQFVEKSIIQSSLANWISKCGPYVYIGTNRKAQLPRAEEVEKSKRQGEENTF